MADVMRAPPSHRRQLSDPDLDRGPKALGDRHQAIVARHEDLDSRQLGACQVKSVEATHSTPHKLRGAASKRLDLGLKKGPLGQPGPRALGPPRQRVLLILQIMRHRPDEREPRRTLGEEAENGLGFHADSRLSLVVERPLQAAEVQVQLHIAIIA